jgi:hypothetical protein
MVETQLNGSSQPQTKLEDAICLCAQDKEKTFKFSQYLAL